MLLMLLLFSLRIDFTDPGVLARIQALAAAEFDAARRNAATASPQRPRPEASSGRAPATAGVRSRRLPPPISSLGRPRPLTRTRTADGRLVISTHDVGRPERVVTQRREGRLTMHLVQGDHGLPAPPTSMA